VTSHCENQTLQITTVKLDGLNCLAWSQFAQTYSKMGNVGQIYELKHRIHGTTQ